MPEDNAGAGAIQLEPADRERIDGFLATAGVPAG